MLIGSAAATIKELPAVTFLTSHGGCILEGNGTGESMNTWIVCANEQGARIFETRNFSEGIRFLKESRGDETILGSVADELDLVRSRGNYRFLVLCAEEPLLSRLRGMFSEQVRDCVIGTVDQDLYQVNESDLVNYVRDFIVRAHQGEEKAA